MVERHSKALTETHDSFGPKRVRRVHRIRDVEVGVAEVYVSAYLLEGGRGAKDPDDGCVMREYTHRYGRSELRRNVVLGQGR